MGWELINSISRVGRTCARLEVGIEEEHGRDKRILHEREQNATKIAYS